MRWFSGYMSLFNYHFLNIILCFQGHHRSLFDKVPNLSLAHNCMRSIEPEQISRLLMALQESISRSEALLHSGIDEPMALGFIVFLDVIVCSYIYHTN